MQRLTPVTDPIEVEALTKLGKYREGVPFWKRAGEILWVDTEELKTWRAVRQSH